ncbi:MAG: hypothetical protein ABL878_02070 [Burkholderiales bacterium]
MQKALDAALPKASASTNASNPPPPFPAGTEKVAKTLLIPKGSEARPPTAESLRNHYAQHPSTELSDDAKIIVAVLFQQKDRYEATPVRDLYDYSSDLPENKVIAALQQLTERGLVELKGNTVSLTAAGMNAALGIVRNPRL